VTVRVIDERHRAWLRIVLDGPKGNLLSLEMVRAVAAALDSSSAQRKWVTFEGAGGNFSFGAMIQEHVPGPMEQVLPEMHALIRRILALPAATAALVNGRCLGGGFELALACDVIVADPTAVVGLPEVTVGVIPGGGGTQLLPRRVGAARAAQLIFTGRRVPAAEALALGLVDVLAEQGEDRGEALALAERMAANSPVGLRAAKRALRMGQGTDLRTGLDVEDSAWRTVAFSADRAEGVAAFNEKRTPDWPGL
jgi:cyclohexa-1,5-dienecarbonyl-CoA hydratase